MKRQECTKQHDQAFLEVMCFRDREAIAEVSQKRLLQHNSISHGDERLDRCSMPEEGRWIHAVSWVRAFSAYTRDLLSSALSFLRFTSHLLPRCFWVLACMSLPMDAKSSTQMPWIAKMLDSNDSRRGGFSNGIRLVSHVSKVPRLITSEMEFSYFWPMVENRKHQIWWDTGSVVFSSRLGYRRMFKPVLGEVGYWGVYGAYEWSLGYDAYRGHMGTEIVSTRFGECVIDFHKMLFLKSEDIYRNWRKATIWGLRSSKYILSPTSLVDDWGVSGTFSYAFLTRLKGSLLCAYSRIWNTEALFDDREAGGEEGILNVGVSVELIFSNQFSMQCTYTLIDKYKEGELSIVLRCGLYDNNLNRDLIRRRLRRPVEVTAPFYLQSWSVEGRVEDYEWNGQYNQGNHQQSSNNQGYQDDLIKEERDLARQYAAMVSRVKKISAQEISALSSEDFHRLHKFTYVRGFHTDKVGSGQEAKERAKQFMGLHQNLKGVKEKLEERRKWGG